jgi:predicted nucleotidyltransferase
MRSTSERTVRRQVFQGDHRIPERRGLDGDAGTDGSAGSHGRGVSTADAGSGEHTPRLPLDSGASARPAWRFGRCDGDETADLTSFEVGRPVRDAGVIGFISAAQRSAIGEICRRHGVRRLALVGTAALADFDPDIDVAEILVDAIRADVSLDDDLDQWIDFTIELEHAVEAPLELLTRDEFEADPPPRDPAGGAAELLVWSCDDADDAVQRPTA